MRPALEALARTDAGVGAALASMKGRDDTLLLMAADSDAGGLQAHDRTRGIVDPMTRGGGILHGQESPLSDAFETAPDKTGGTHFFGVSWTGCSDMAGGILARGAGLNSDLIAPLMDKTDVYAVMRQPLLRGSN
ncbi:MAG: hypothetical protein AAFO72_09515 [Pseudomonadota bacterium]